MELSHVNEMMGRIKPGDRISFNSVGACNSPTKLCRSGSATIPAMGTVVKVYPTYAVLRLKVARECVMWDSIAKVNGISWPLFNEGEAS